jgi:hypothetical protein
MQSFVKEVGEAGQGYVQSHMPVFSHDAFDSIKHVEGVTSTSASTRIFTTEDEAKMMTIEHGRQPGAKPPPIGAVAGWARAHNVDATWLARRIGEKGSHNYPVGHQPFAKGAEQTLSLAEYLSMEIVNVF